MSDIDRQTIRNLPSAQPEQQHGRVFKGIVVEYPSYNTYPEYKGKPYFLIKYTENGQEYIGYGTYKPEVLSEFLKEYFMPSAQAKERTEERTEMHACDLIDRQAAIDADSYCRDCKRSIYGEYADCDINIENNGRYVKGDFPCYCKIGLDGKRAEKYPWERREE